MARIVNIADAMAKLLRLVEGLADAPESVVWMPRPRRTRFRLEGSMRLVGTADDVERDLAALRKEQAERTIAKFRDL